MMMMKIVMKFYVAGTQSIYGAKFFEHEIKKETNSGKREKRVGVAENLQQTLDRIADGIDKMRCRI